MIPLGLTAASSATDAVIQKRTHCSRTSTLIVSNEEMENIMKIVKSLEESTLLKKVLMNQLKTSQRNRKMDFLVFY